MEGAPSKGSPLPMSAAQYGTCQFSSASSHSLHTPLYPSLPASHTKRQRSVLTKSCLVSNAMISRFLRRRIFPPKMVQMTNEYEKRRLSDTENHVGGVVNSSSSSCMPQNRIGDSELTSGS